MIIREFEGLDTSDRKRIFAECKCTICNSTFVKQKRQLNIHGTCSLQCTNVVKGNSLVCSCDHCGNLFFKPKSKIAASKSGKLFCCRSCKDLAQSYMLEIQPDHYGADSAYRSKAFKNYEPICARCGYDNVAALEVHHIDSNRNNNLLGNLKILCANCHTLTHKGL